MILSEQEALQRIVAPRNRKHLDSAALQEERLILHSESVLEKHNLPYTSFRNFTMWWQSLISEVKYNRIDELLNCPMFTVGIVKDIFDNLQKFVDAQDRYIDFKFTDVDYTNDFNRFLERTNDEEFWRSRVIEGLKTDICSYLIIDLPAIQTTERPEPYNYIVSPRLVKDVEINKFSQKVEFIIFKQSDFVWDEKMSGSYTSPAFSLLAANDKMEKLICIDDQSYRVYVKKQNTREEVIGNWILLSKSDHNLGYCPVIDFWKDSIKGTNGINKLGPITLQLQNLDYILFFKACVDFMNLYGPFPIMVTYDMTVDEYDDKTKEVNTGGGYDYSKTNPISTFNTTQNPRRTGRKFMAPGGGLEVPVPATPADHDFMKNPMKFVNMDVENVKLANELLEDMEDAIVEKCTGINQDYMNEIAKNAEMLAASFRKEETILTWIKRNVERIHRFAVKTKCELRYGKEYFLGCTIDYGSDYMLKDSSALTKELKESIDNGMPSLYSSEISLAAIHTRFKNNPEKLARMKILLDLEPYPNMTFEKIKMLGLDVIDNKNFIIKANFTSLISQFELENGSIVLFGEQIPYSKKISIIKQTLNDYVGRIEITRQPTFGGTPSNGI